MLACHSLPSRQGEVDLQDKEDHFKPPLGNVAFASAHDGWAFRISQLAKQYADKLGCKASGLAAGLWGTIPSKPRPKGFKPDQTHKHKPLFVQVSVDGLLPFPLLCRGMGGRSVGVGRGV